MAWYRCGGTPSNILALPTPSEASGAIARFNTDLTENLLSAVAEFSASQASGTPTPSAPIPIVGVDKVNITRTGKNLFNPDNVINGYLSNQAVIKATATTRTVYTECKPNTTYTVSKTAGQRFQVAYCDSLPEAEVQCSGMIANGTASSITITTDSTAKYLVAYIYHSSYDTITAEQMISSVQIEEGSEATDYEPYNGTTALINLGGTYYGGSVDAVTGKITLTHILRTFDGSENWAANKNTYTDTQYFILKVGDYGYVDTSKPQLSNIYSFDLNLSNNTMVCFAVVNSSARNRAQLSVRPENVASMTSVSDFTSILSQTNMTVAFAISKPLVVYASNTAEIPTIVGDNQVFADTGDVALKYFETVGHKI